MLRPREVKVTFYLATFDLELLAVGVNRSKELVGPGLLPAFRRSENPLHLLVSTDLDDGRLVTGRQNDRVIGRVVVNRVNVRPVAARTRANDIAEMITCVKLGQFLGRQRLTGLTCVNVQAHRTLIEYLHHVVAVRIENFPQTPFVDHLTVAVDFDNHVAHGANTLVVGAAQIGARCTDKGVAVLRVIKRMREVDVAHRQTAVVNFAAHQIVLDVTLTVTPGDVAVFILLEAHHHARAIHLLDVVDRFNMHVPAHFTLGVNDGDHRIEVPFHRAAHRVVPNHASGLGVLLHQIVDKVQTVGELRIHLDDLGFEHIVRKRRVAAHFVIYGGGVDRIGFRNLFGLAVELARVAHLNLVVVVGIKAENRNAGVGEKLLATHLVFDFLTVFLGHDAHRSFGEFVTAVFDDGGKRSNLVRIDDDFAELALCGKRHARARRAAGCGSRPRESARNKCGNGAHEQRTTTDGDSHDYLSQQTVQKTKAQMSFRLFVHRKQGSFLPKWRFSFPFSTKMT